MVISIGRGAHLRIENVPLETWTDALAHGSGSHGTLLLPKLLPANAVMGITQQPNLEHIPPIDKPIERIVTARGIDAFPPSERHGPIYRGLLFRHFPFHLRAELSATLLTWQASDFAFREVAFAFLCLAAGLQIDQVPCLATGTEYNAGYSNLHPTEDQTGLEGPAAEELLAHLASGVHVKGHQPGSAPKLTTYWFGGALVKLVARLDQEDVLNNAIESVRWQCLSERPARATNAILFSIEHAVLLRIYPRAKQIERTELLTLFGIASHRPLHPNNRFTASSMAEIPAKTHSLLREGFIGPRHPQSEIYGKCMAEPLTRARDDLRESTSTFFRLAWFFECSARHELAPRRVGTDILPTDIWDRILSYIHDIPTYRTFMQISLTCRKIAQRSCLISDGMWILPSELTSSFNWNDDDRDVPPILPFPEIDMEKDRLIHWFYEDDEVYLQIAKNTELDRKNPKFPQVFNMRLLEREILEQRPRRQARRRRFRLEEESEQQRNFIKINAAKGEMVIRALGQFSNHQWQYKSYCWFPILGDQFQQRTILNWLTLCILPANMAQQDPQFI